MYKYVGDFTSLVTLGFIQNVYKTYYFLPTKKQGKFYNPLVIDSETRLIEYVSYDDLNLIKDYIERV